MLLLLTLLLQLLLHSPSGAQQPSNCGVGMIYQTDQTTIVSHHLFSRQAYSASSQCRYIIRAWTPEYRIEVSAVDFSLEYSDSCSADSLTVYGGSNDTSAVLGKFCGSSLWSVLSTGSSMSLIFETDGYVEKGGFRLRYRFVPKEEVRKRVSCPNNFLACSDGRGCYPKKWKCDGIRDCSDGSDEALCNGQTLNCPPGQKPCKDNSKCVFNNWWCDNFKDCPDNSDENCDAVTTTPSPGGGQVTQKPPSSNCGSPSIAPDETRIVGGKPAIPHSWPWMVSLRLFGGHFCGGSVYNDYWIITAAHCVEGYMNVNNWKVDAGRNCRDCSESSLQRKSVVRIVRHPNYESSRTNRDIAMMKMNSPLQFNQFVSPVCLPSTSASGGTPCFATGWGATQNTGDNRILRQVSVPVVPNSICGDSSHYGGAITGDMICAGYEQGGKDACQGDSGGPLVCKSSGRWYLQGITSWGEGCARPQRPGVYTRVSNFVGWIAQTVANN